MMGTKRDYYERLGVSRSASADEIKREYRNLVKQFHPDRVSEDKKKEAEEKFKEISEAYAVLSDPQKRQLYDQYGHAGIDSRFTTEDIFRGANFADIFGGMNGFGSIFEDFFSDLGFDIFGGRRGRGRRTRTGEDAHFEAAISLEEAGKGVEKNITYQRYEACPQCNGSGAEKGAGKVPCPMCNGSGMVRSGMGFISFAQTCPTCQGEGSIIKNKCKLCTGSGSIKKKKTIKVTIPAGVQTGSILRLRSEGHFVGSGYGDLYVHIRVNPHSVFERHGDDLRCRVKISLVKAVLGGNIEVPTLNGRVNMRIPSGTQSSTVFRLKGKGITNLRTKHSGDELVEVDVEIPKKLSLREKRLFEELAKLRKET
ncbi:MAG: molecular chaperone DnaJ [Candidatus Omnitrophota bacterium]|nr:MAG: molecular chaperone DnaJ [Candidatus Omnitrophota bacterium]